MDWTWRCKPLRLLSRAESLCLSAPVSAAILLLLVLPSFRYSSPVRNMRFLTCSSAMRNMLLRYAKDRILEIFTPLPVGALYS
jgi:hypothetical protein